MDDQRDFFLTSAQVRARYGNASGMWIYRREHEHNSKFPKPIRVQNRKLWKLSDLEAWEASLSAPNAEAAA